MSRVGIIGAGSWGTALSLVLANNGHSVEIWSIVESEIDMLKEKKIDFKVSSNGRQMASGKLVVICDTPLGKGEVEVKVINGKEDKASDLSKDKKEDKASDSDKKDKKDNKKEDKKEDKKEETKTEDTKAEKTKT